MCVLNCSVIVLLFLLGNREALCSFPDDKALNFTVLALVLGPDKEVVGLRRVSKHLLRSVQEVAITDFVG